MRKLILCLILVIAGCATSGSEPQQKKSVAEPTMVGAWVVTAKRPRGDGKNLLTFSSDGTFFRSGDSHPVLSGGHGAWKRIGERQYQATYVAFVFDQQGKWTGSTQTRIQITLDASGDAFRGMTKTSQRDLEDKEIQFREGGRLEGRRIEVVAF